MTPPRIEAQRRGSGSEGQARPSRPLAKLFSASARPCGRSASGCPTRRATIIGASAPRFCDRSTASRHDPGPRALAPMGRAGARRCGRRHAGRSHALASCERWADFLESVRGADHGPCGAGLRPAKITEAFPRPIAYLVMCARRTAAYPVTRVAKHRAQMAATSCKFLRISSRRGRSR
jgi:hypothetical protein